MNRKLLITIGMLVLLFGLVDATKGLQHSSPAPLLVMMGLLFVCAAAVCGIRPE